MITALLGPTNTGKTHHAIERMLEHASGMIGLPLRLLAREVYDRITARVGESRVALVTGEEQRIPRKAAYWIATVEAMPMNHDVDFLAVDEIQLAAHAQRGHVFTSRLLHARGRLETWFLGSESMRGILGELVPTAKHVEHPRLSSLLHAGARTIAKLPPRSAVVAFSMPHVYELADKMRARRGGAAVVLGALSPRTRNAQVAMFQAGEVDCLVATDAIGMGLNLDVEHVAFAATRKFDGRDVRDVDDAELAQIAGRAGRWIHDGTFGTLSPLGLPVSTVRAIEGHAFPAIRKVQWRSEDLDFSSIASLRASLAEPPRRALFRHAAGAEDAACLALLADRPAVKSRREVQLLWDVCTVPDFRKLMLEVHADFLETLFVELVDHGRVRSEWIERQIPERESSTIEDLIEQIAQVRTWTYIANRTSWLASPWEWQERTRALEDRLSDVLHERLVGRFVEVRKKTARSSAAAKGNPFAQLAELQAPPQAAPSSPIAWVDALVAAEHADFVLREAGEIAFEERVVGKIVRGPSVSLPDVTLADLELGAGAKSRVHRRLLAFARDVVAELTGGVGTLATREASAPMRGFVHRFEQGLGKVKLREVEDVLAVMSPEDRTKLEEAGVVFDEKVVYVRVARPEGRAARRTLLSLGRR